MGNENQGAWFLTRLAIIGSPIEVIQAAIPDLIEEIDARPHLRSHNLSWDADARHVCVEVENWGYDPEHAANGMAEELFEIAAAVLGDFEEFHVEILATDQKGSDLHSPDTDCPNVEMLCGDPPFVIHRGAAVIAAVAPTLTLEARAGAHTSPTLTRR